MDNESRDGTRVDYLYNTQKACLFLNRIGINVFPAINYFLVPAFFYSMIILLGANIIYL